MRTGLLIIAALLIAGEMLNAADAPVGTDAVESLLKICSDAGVIVSEKDLKTGTVPQDPKLGVSKFIVPDETKLRATLRANKSLTENVDSRNPSRGCVAGGTTAAVRVGRIHSGRELKTNSRESPPC